MPILVLPFPVIDPVLIEIGPIAIRWYALAYIVGLLLGWRYARLLADTERLWGGRPHPSPLDFDDFLVWAAFGIILGGRVGYVLFYNPAVYFGDPMAILRVWQGGMAFHGGFLGAVVAMVIFAWRRGLNVWSVFDVIAAVVTIGLFFGRIANFINAELYGRVSDVAWAMVFPGGGPHPRHPSQLYEAVLEGLVLFVITAILIWRGSWLARPGFICGVFTFGYGVMRIIAEFFRMPDAHIGFLAGNLTMGILLSIPMCLAGLVAMFAAWRGWTAGNAHEAQ